MQKDSKIYIAGHTGLVGSAVVRVLQKAGFTNLIFQQQRDLDLCNQSDVNNFFNKELPEYVFLAAARVGGIWANKTQKADFIYDNLMIATNVINAAKKFGVKKLLNLGSSCIYPKLAPQPLKEEYLLTGPLEETNDAYAIAKITAIKLCRHFNEQYGTNFISVMPTNLYGPNDNFNLETAHVLPAMIRKFHLAKLLKQKNFVAIRSDFDNFDTTKTFTDNKIIEYLETLGIESEKLTLWGSGDVFREFLYVDDLASALIFLMQNYNYQDIGEIINIGTGQDLKINELAQLIKKVVEFDGEVHFDREKPDGTPKKLLDVSRISNLGWEPKISLEAGIKKVYEWYRV
jgi:GDP-L-fucose synthase